MQCLRLVFILTLLIGLSWTIGCDTPFAAQFAIDSAPNTDSRCPFIDKLLAVRDPLTFSSELNEVLSAITMGTNTTPVGSFKYQQQKYPGDIDIFETIEVSLPRDQAKEYFAQRISNVAMRVSGDPDLIFSDFKAGFDERLKIDIGKLEKDTIVGYEHRAVHEAIDRLKNEALISDTEHTDLVALIKENPSTDEWEELKEAVRQLFTLRWTLSELMAQEKILRGNKIISLADAIDNSLVKIDLLAPVTKIGGYTEVTTIFNLIYIENGVSKNFTEKMADYRDSVTKDVLAFFDKKHRKHLKGAKRLWLLSTILKDNEVTAKLMPLLADSNAAALNQVISESEVVRRILSPEHKIFCSPVGHRLLRQIGSFEKRILENTTDIPVDLLSNPDDGLLRSIFESLQKDCPRDAANADAIVVSEETKDLANKNLERLEEMVFGIVDNLAKDFLLKAGVNPDNPMGALTGRENVCPIETGPQ